METIKFLWIHENNNIFSKGEFGAAKQRFNLELQVEDALKNAYRKPFKTRDGKFWIKKAKASAKRSLATKAKAKAASKNKSVDGKRSESKKVEAAKDTVWHRVLRAVTEHPTLYMNQIRVYIVLAFSPTVTAERGTLRRGVRGQL